MKSRQPRPAKKVTLALVAGPRSRTKLPPDLRGATACWGASDGCSRGPTSRSRWTCSGARALETVRHEGVKLTVVFDGPPPSGSPALEHLWQVSVRYSGRSSADDVIVDLLRSSNRTYRDCHALDLTLLIDSATHSYVDTGEMFGEFMAPDSVRDAIENPSAIEAWHAMNTWVRDIIPMAGGAYKQLINSCTKKIA